MRPGGRRNYSLDDVADACADDAGGAAELGRRDRLRTITAIDTVARTVVVNGSTIAVPAGARIDGGRDGVVTFADLKVGWQVTIRASQSGSVITAKTLSSSCAVTRRSRSKGRWPLGGSCPAVTFNVGTAAVATTASTSFDGSCSRLANGILVVVDGNLGSGASIAATRVSIRSEENSLVPEPFRRRAAA